MHSEQTECFAHRRVIAKKCSGSERDVARDISDMGRAHGMPGTRRITGR